MHSLNQRIFHFISLMLIITFIIGFESQEVWAAGKKRANPCNPDVPGSPQFSTPSPIRNVLLSQIGTKVFQLPNGASVDFNLDLQTILTTSVINTVGLAPTDPNGKDPCNAHLELRSAVTTFQLDVIESGVSFGFNPSGALATITSINGEAKVKIGMIAMDFSLWRCAEGYCSAVTAATANHLVLGGEITFDLNFGDIKTGAELIVNPVLGLALRSIMNDAMKKLASSPQIPNLPWTSIVREYDPATGIVIFDDGAQSGLLPNQTFIVYKPTNDSPQGVCDVFLPVAFIHTTSVFPVSSEAIVDKILNPRGIQTGDVVMIRKAEI